MELKQINLTPGHANKSTAVSYVINYRLNYLFARVFKPVASLKILTCLSHIVSSGIKK